MTAARAKARPVREASEERSVAREPARDELPAHFYDKETGELLTRKRKNGVFDEFEFSPSEIPEGMDYQWIRVTVHGSPEESEYHLMYENGWRAVPWERHSNRFAKSEFMGKGSIIRRGQLLVERPIHLSKQAREEDQRRANEQIQGQFKRFNVEFPDSVRGMGINPGRPVARQQTDDVFSVRQDAMPKHEIAID